MKRGTKRKDTTVYGRLKQQYLASKKSAPANALLVVEYEKVAALWFEDAIIAARELGLVLDTHKHPGERERAIPTCGVPADTWRTGLNGLLLNGHPLVVCTSDWQHKSILTEPRRKKEKRLMETAIISLRNLDRLDRQLAEDVRVRMLNAQGGLTYMESLWQEARENPELFNVRARLLAGRSKIETLRVDENGRLVALDPQPRPKDADVLLEGVGAK